MENEAAAMERRLVLKTRCHVSGLGSGPTFSAIRE
jgi:hypothetical protein